MGWVCQRRVQWYQPCRVVGVHPPRQSTGALGGLGGLLVGSGQALVQGFISGITSMIGAVAAAAHRVVQAARDFFPFSPAKKGPFSGHGYTVYSGKALAKDFAAGIDSEAGAAAQAARGLMGAAAGNLKGYEADAGFAGTTAGSRTGGPQVDTSIHIGQLVAADMSAPLREVKSMQLKAQIMAGQA